MQWLALLPPHWSPTKLMVASLLRVVLVPLLLLCVAPSPSSPVISSGVAVWAIIFTLILGISNGYFGSLPMINVSAEVDNPQHKELASVSLQCIVVLCQPRSQPFPLYLTALEESAQSFPTPALSQLGWGRTGNKASLMLKCWDVPTGCSNLKASTSSRHHDDLDPPYWTDAWLCPGLCPHSTHKTG